MVQRAVYYTNDLDTAEDIVREVFMRLWEKREELRGFKISRDIYFLASE